MVRILSVIVLLICSISALATDYYCSDTGSNSNNGLSDLTPFDYVKAKTISYLPGDKLLLKRGGTYFGSWELNRYGTAGNSITIGAYGTGANPVITGFTTVTAWTNLGSNIWESTSAVSELSNCNMVSINGVNTEMGRYPNSSAANEGYLTFQTHSGKTSITSSSLTGTPNWTGAEVVIRTGHFVIDRSTITGQSAGTLTFNAISPYEPGDGNGFFIQNDSRTLDVQNEWYYNPTTKKIRIYSASQPTNVKVASVEKLIDLKGNYLKFENIDFSGANGAAMYCWDSTPRYNHVTVKDCNFSYMGAAAINVLIDYLTVEGCSINQVNGGAISSSYGSHVYIKNNTIGNIGLLKGMKTKTYFGTDSAVSAGTVSGFVFEYNNVTSVAYNGLGFYGDSIRIRYNYIDNFCKVLDDGGGIYTFTGERTSMTDVLISNNIVVNGIGAAAGSQSPHIAAGIYLDERSKNCEVSYNSVGNVAESGIFLNTSAGNINVHHNTVFNASKYQYYSTYWGTENPISPPTGNQVKYNIFVSLYTAPQYDQEEKAISFYFARSDGSAANDLMLASTALDYNVYARPQLDTKTVRFNHALWNPGFCTLAEWQAFSGQDLHTTKAPYAVGSTDDFYFAYNATASAKDVTLPGNYQDLLSTYYYIGKINLPAYSSKVLRKTSYIPPPAGTLKLRVNTQGKPIINKQNGLPLFTR